MRVGIFTDNDFDKINGVTTTLKAVLRFADGVMPPRVYTASDVGVDTSSYFAAASLASGYRGTARCGSIGRPFVPSRGGSGGVDVERFDPVRKSTTLQDEWRGTRRSPLILYAAVSRERKASRSSSLFDDGWRVRGSRPASFSSATGRRAAFGLVDAIDAPPLILSEESSR